MLHQYLDLDSSRNQIQHDVHFAFSARLKKACFQLPLMCSHAVTLQMSQMCWATKMFVRVRFFANTSFASWHGAPSPPGRFWGPGRFWRSYDGLHHKPAQTAWCSCVYLRQPPDLYRSPGLWSDTTFPSKARAGSGPAVLPLWYLDRWAASNLKQFFWDHSDARAGSLDNACQCHFVEDYSIIASKIGIYNIKDTVYFSLLYSVHPKVQCLFFCLLHQSLLISAWERPVQMQWVRSTATLCP